MEWNGMEWNVITTGAQPARPPAPRHATRARALPLHEPSSRQRRTSPASWPSSLPLYWTRCWCTGIPLSCCCFVVRSAASIVRSFDRSTVPLEIVGNRWKSLEIVGDRWKSLEIVGDRWRSLEIVGNRWECEVSSEESRTGAIRAFVFVGGATNVPARLQARARSVPIDRARLSPACRAPNKPQPTSSRVRDRSLELARSFDRSRDVCVCVCQSRARTNHARSHLARSIARLSSRVVETFVSGSGSSTDGPAAVFRRADQAPPAAGHP